MSRYTTTVRFICEFYADFEESQGLTTVNGIIENARTKVFDFDYPIFDMNYKPVLERKILKHFYMREICAETVALWKLWLDDRLNMIMPYYNLLYKSELLEYNPLFDYKLVKTGGREKETFDKLEKIDKTENTTGTTDKRTTDGAENLTSEDNTHTISDKSNNETASNTIAETSDSNAETSNADKFSDMPQSSIDNIDDNGYLTNLRKVDSINTNEASFNSTVTNKLENNVNENTDVITNLKSNKTAKTEYNQTQDVKFAGNFTSNQTKDNNSQENYIEMVEGKLSNVSYSKLVEEFRKSFLNIDMMIINELNDLFFGLWE